MTGGSIRQRLVAAYHRTDEPVVWIGAAQEHVSHTRRIDPVRLVRFRGMNEAPDVFDGKAEPVAIILEQIGNNHFSLAVRSVAVGADQAAVKAADEVLRIGKRELDLKLHRCQPRPRRTPP